MCEQQCLSVEAACKLFGRSRQAYYKSKTDHAERRRHELKVLDTVREIRAEDIRIGGYKLWLMVKDIFPEGWIPGRDNFYKLLSQNHLTLQRPKPRHTTNSNHRFHKYTNLYKEIVPVRPNEVWGADITYIDVGDEDCYLHLITDAYSRKILGWTLSDSLAAVNTKEALMQAIAQTLLYAIHSEKQAQGITSMAFNKKYRLRSPSSTQSATLKLLEYDLITRAENTYSISDPLLSLWLDRRKV